MNEKKPRYPFPESLVAQVAALPSMPIAELKALWRETFKTEPPTYRRPYLERRLGYQLQENAYRKHNPTLLEQNEQRIDQLIKYGVQKKRDGKHRLEPGTTLIREYREVEHRVTVTLDGDYEYEGKRYSSLSVIAREITGTRWSGPLFFGLKSPKIPKKSNVARAGK